MFGPRPRSYSFKMNRKMKQNARKSALSLKASDKAIKVVEDFSFEEPKTRRVSEILDALELNGKSVLILTSETDRNIYMSARNIPKVEVLEAYKPTTYQILKADAILIQKSAVEVLENSVQPNKQEEAA